MAKVVLKFNPEGQNAFDLDDNDIVRLDSLSQSTPDASGVNYGCIANTGSVSIIDYNGNIANMIESGELPVSNMGVDVFLNKNKIQSHITTDSSYDENTKTLNISFSNTVKDLSTRIFSGYKYPNIYKTAYDLLYVVMNEWFGRTLDEYSEFRPMLSEKIFYDGTATYTEISSYLSYIRIQYPIIEPNQTFADVINQICELAQIQMFIGSDGSFKFISGRPVGNIEKAIHIPSRNIASDFKKDVFVKNKYDGVDIIESLVNVSIDYSKFITKVETGDVFESTQNILPSSFSASDLTSGVFDFEKTSTGKDIAYIKAGRAYISGTAYIPINSNMNLEQVQKVSSSLFSNNDQNSPKYSINFLYETKSCSSTKTSTSSDTFNSGLTIGNTSSEFETTGNYDNNLTYDAIVDIPFDTHLKPSVTLKDDSKLTISEDLENNRFIINYYILACQYEITMKSKFENQITSSIPMSGNIRTKKAKSIEISLYGDVKKIEFSDTIEKHLGANDARLKVTIPSNKLLQDKTFFGSKKLSDVMSSNILSDYANGVKTARLTVVAVDYYDSNGNKVLNKDAGELIQVGDIVEVEGQKNKNGELIKWRVTGSNFKYDGEPLQELELMELIFTKDGRLYYLLHSSGKMYSVQADNDQISGSLILGGTYNNGETGPLDVTSVSENGFYSCKGITEVVIQDKIGVIYDRAFAYSGISQLIINTSVDCFASTQAFMECVNLKKVYLLGKFYSFTDSCFDGCLNLSEMYIGKNLTFIGDYAFINCPNLKDIYYEGTEEDWNKIFIYASNNSVLDNVTIHYNSKIDM